MMTSSLLLLPSLVLALLVPSQASVPAQSICNTASFPDLSLTVSGEIYTYNPCNQVTTSVCNHPNQIQFCQQYQPPASYSWTAAYYQSGNPSISWYFNARGQLTSNQVNGDQCTQAGVSFPRTISTTYLCDSTVPSSMVSVIDGFTNQPPTSNTCNFSVQVVTSAACSKPATSICPALSSSPDIAFTASNGMVYTYNPCAVVTTSQCNHPNQVQFCQLYQPPNGNSWTAAYYQSGNPSVTWSRNVDGLLVSTESNGDQCTSVSPAVPRSVVTTYVCDSTVSTLRLVSVVDAATGGVANSNTCAFSIVVTSSAVC